MNLKYLCFKDINRTTAPLLRQKIGVAGAWSMERGGGARRREVGAGSEQSERATLMYYICMM